MLVWTWLQNICIRIFLLGQIISEMLAYFYAVLDCILVETSLNQHAYTLLLDVSPVA